jgi:thiol-disulfide isomerase/thioredoxin
MKSVFNIMVCILFAFSFKTSLGQKAREDEVLTGIVEVDLIEKGDGYAWFKTGYDNYSPNNPAVVALDTMPPNFSFVVFCGSWCDDTHQLLPAFYKAIDMAGFPRNKVTLYFVDREKKSPAGDEKRYDVEYIPTFIVMKNGKEKGRVVETVEKSIEQDLLEILVK